MADTTDVPVSVVADVHGDGRIVAVLVRVAAENRPLEQITAQHGNHDFDHEEQNRLLACAVGQQKRNGFVRGGQKDGNQRSRCEKAFGEQGRGCGGKAALRNAASQRANDWADLLRFFHQMGRGTHFVLHPVEHGIYNEEDGRAFDNVLQRMRNRMDNKMSHDVLLC